MNLENRLKLLEQKTLHITENPVQSRMNIPPETIRQALLILEEAGAINTEGFDISKLSDEQLTNLEKLYTDAGVTE